MTEQALKEQIKQNRLDTINAYLFHIPILMKRLNHYKIMSNYFKRLRWKLVAKKYARYNQYTMAKNRRYTLRQERLDNKDVYSSEREYNRLFRELAKEVFTMIISCSQLELIEDIEQRSIEYMKVFEQRYKYYYDKFTEEILNPTK